MGSDGSVWCYLILQDAVCIYIYKSVFLIWEMEISEAADLE